MNPQGTVEVPSSSGARTEERSRRHETELMEQVVSRPNMTDAYGQVLGGETKRPTSNRRLLSSAYAEQRSRRNRRHASSGSETLSAGELGKDQAGTADGKLQAPAGTTGRDTETRRRGTASGHTDRTRPPDPASPSSDVASHIRPRILGAQIQFQERQEREAGSAQGAGIYTRGLWKCSGHRLGEVLRQSEPRHAHQGKLVF